jgi:hypothetical protein
MKNNDRDSRDSRDLRDSFSITVGEFRGGYVWRICDDGILLLECTLPFTTFKDACIDALHAARILIEDDDVVVAAIIDAEREWREPS